MGTVRRQYNYALYYLKLYIMSMAGTWVVFKIRSIE
jgi:hypothetical protein